MSEIGERRLKKAAEDLFAGVEDMEQDRLMNDIRPVMKAMQDLNPDGSGALELIEEGLASLEGAKLSVLAAVLGMTQPTDQFFENLDFAEKKISEATKFITTLREVGEVRRARK